MAEQYGLIHSYPFTIIHDFSADEWQSAREPVLRRMPDGSLLCLHYTGGPWEPHDENCVVRTVSTDDGENWSKPEVLFNHPRRATWSPEMFVEGGKPMIFVQTFCADRWYGEMKAYLTCSDDEGKTFSEPVMMPGASGNVVMRRTIVLSNGDWLIPCYWQELLSGFENKFTRQKLSDGGNWLFCTGAIVAKDQNWRTANLYGDIRSDTILFWEPNAIEVAPGHVVMFIRASGTGYLYRSDSVDFGRTWSPYVPTDIPNADTKLTLLKIGDAVVLINNPTTQGRSRIELWVSRDGCESWDKKIELVRLADANAAGRNEHYIPPMVCYPDGFADEHQRLLYVAYEDGARHYLMKVPFADFL